jgi:hypothetical protein
MQYQIKYICLVIVCGLSSMVLADPPKCDFSVLPELQAATTNYLESRCANSQYAGQITTMKAQLYVPGSCEGDAVKGVAASLSSAVEFGLAGNSQKCEAQLGDASIKMSKLERYLQKYRAVIRPRATEPNTNP